MARRLFILVCLVVSLRAATRPDVNTTLRGLTRLPRVELRFSLDFDAERGFVALRTEADPAATIGATHLKLDGSGGDAKTWLDLAALRLDANDAAAARRDFQRAADSARKRLDIEPGNARLQIILADALHGLGRQTEAESILREGVKGAPNSSTNWLALASFLDARAWELVTDTQNWHGRRGYAALARGAIRRQADSETADRALRLIDEALGAARTAVQLDEKSPRAQHRLGVLLASKECFLAVRRRLAGQESSALVESMIFSRVAIEPFEKAAALDSENPLRLALLTLWRGFAEAAERRIPLADWGERPIWEILPSETRRVILAELERLRAFENSSAGGDALQALGTLRLVLLNDLPGAIDHLRTAAGLDPDAEQLWETLTLALTRRKDYLELAAVCEARALVRPTVRNRILLAKAHEKLGNTLRALEETASAVALNGSDFLANLALANVLMKISDDSDISSRVRQSLVAAERAIRTSGTGAQYVDLALAQGLYHALAGEEDRAREIFKSALAYAKDNPEITAALSAIGY